MKPGPKSGVGKERGKTEQACPDGLIHQKEAHTENSETQD